MRTFKRILLIVFGLAIVAAIVAAHGGSVAVVDDDGGASITARLPVLGGPEA